MNKKPLFGIDIIHLPNGYACYVVVSMMSHAAVGDGTTYYKIIEEINDVLQNRTMREPLIWFDPSISSHQIFP